MCHRRIIIFLPLSLAPQQLETVWEIVRRAGNRRYNWELKKPSTHLFMGTRDKEEFYFARDPIELRSVEALELTQCAPR
ncbi:hypothetical protein F5141DRAFT_1156858 [Pisolithus sp. B1]|nr:hypothetical protein F5141DRAFT_1156858 [Pisolithus sp. B1]